MKKTVIGFFVMLCTTLAAAAAGAGSAPGGPINLLYNLQICEGKYALCAASTCMPTGGTIAVNVASGGTALFPEAACTGPYSTGPR